jgi:hypothetical protein
MNRTDGLLAGGIARLPPPAAGLFGRLGDGEAATAGGRYIRSAPDKCLSPGSGT